METNAHMPYLSRACPSCSETAGSIAVQAKTPAETLTLDALTPYWRGFFNEKTFFSYFRCHQCKLMYCPTFFTDQQLEALYAQMPDNTAGNSLEMLQKTQGGYFQQLKPYAQMEGAYLETGPDLGLFTQHIINEGHFSKYWLFEPNKAVWPNLTRRFPRPNEVHLSSEMFGFGPVPDESVQLAVMVHVLDHLLDPLSILLQLRQKLKPGSTVAFVTHDESSLLAKLTRAGWPPYCLQHPQLFNAKSITGLLSKAGFKVLAVQRTSNYFPATYLLKHLLWALGIQVNLPQSNSLQLPLKLGNILTIATPSV